MAKKKVSRASSAALGIGKAAKVKPLRVAKSSGSHGSAPAESIKGDVLAVIAATLSGPVRYLQISNTCTWPLNVWVSKDDAIPLTWQQMSVTVPAKVLAAPGVRTYDLTALTSITSGVRLVRVKRSTTGTPDTTATSGTGFHYSKNATSGTAVYQVSYTAGAYFIAGPTYNS